MSSSPTTSGSAAEPLPDAVAVRDPRRLADAAAAHLRRHDVRFGGHPFTVDPLPRVIDAWDDLAAGLRQRALVLDAFCADIHGPRRSVAEGAIPARVVDTIPNQDAGAAALGPGPGRHWIGIAGLDLVRGPDGRFLVLEDNTRTPSGLGYALAARDATRAALGDDALAEVRPLDVATPLRAVLEATRPAGRHGIAVLLSDGPRNTAFYEHRRLGALLGIPVVGPGELVAREGALCLAATGETVAAVYRRTDDDHSGTPVGRLLAPALRAGTLGLVNAFGTGVADDKLVHAYVGDLTRLLLGEEPLLDGVRTLDLGTDDGLAEALDRIDELVVKPRDAYGGVGVTIGPRCDAQKLAEVRRTVRDDPTAYVAQETVMLSTHPTVVDDGVAPRHIDLRPFVLLARGEAHVLPGGLTRVALRAGEMVVNSSRDGGAKDTWVLR